MTCIAATSTLLAAPAQAAPQKLWYSGFENGHPGEFLDYDNGTYTDNDAPNPGKTEAWSYVGADKFDDILAGDKVYKGWITGTAASSHRAYPSLHTDLPTPLANTFYVWLDLDYDQLDPQTDWVHVGTWGNNPDWKVHTMSVLDRKLHMAHLQGYKYTGPMPQPDFPLKQWVRITVYLHYPKTGDGTVCAWQDGLPVMTGKWTQVDGPNLMRTHWGMYAAASVDHGVQYNDEIQIFSLDAPLADCNGPEPVSPYEQPGDTDGDESTGGETTGGDESTGAAEGTAGESTGSATTEPATTEPETTGPATTTDEPATTTGNTGDSAGSTGGDSPTTDGSAGETAAPGTTSGGTGDGESSGTDGATPTDAGCGCTSGSGNGYGWLALGLLAGLRRRRR